MTHGTRSGYAKYGCRCPECRRAQRDRMREYRHRTVPSTPGATTSLEIAKIAPGDAANVPGARHQEGRS